MEWDVERGNSQSSSRWVTTHTTVESNHTSNTDFFCIKSWKNDGYENYFSSMGFLGQILLMNDLLYITRSPLLVSLSPIKLVVQCNLAEK